VWQVLQLVAEHVPQEDPPAIGTDDPSLPFENDAKEEKTLPALLPQREQETSSLA